MAAIQVIPLLYIKPKNKIKGAVIDELFIQFEKFMAMQLEKKENIGNIKGTKFTVGVPEVKMSKCACGFQKQACYWLMSDGYATHSLAIHMLTYHRDEIPEEEMYIIKKLVG